MPRIPHSPQRPPMPDEQTPKYTIAVIADLSGMPQQQLRRLELAGLLSPVRTAGNARRYSDNDLAQVLEIITLAAEGINMAGIRHILHLRAELGEARAEVARLRSQLEHASHERHIPPSQVV